MSSALDLDTLMIDLRVPQLPWALQDDWGCERTAMDIDVVVAENDLLRAAITPQWGGKACASYAKHDPFAATCTLTNTHINTTLE